MKRCLTLTLVLAMLLCCFIASAENLADTYAGITNEIIFKSTSDLEDAKAASAYRVGVAMTTVSTSWFKKLNDSTEAALKAAGCETLPVVCEDDVETQVTQLENFLAQGVDAVILNPCDPTDALIPVLQELAAANIPVITVDNTPSEASAFLCSISVDAYKLGYGVGSYLAGQLVEMYPDAETIEYALIGGKDGDAIAAARNAGARAGIADTDARIQEAAFLFSGGYSEECGLETAQNMLSAHPDLKCIVGTCDAHVLGASQAMTALGMDDVKIIMGAVDGSEEAMQSIANGGNIVCTGMNDAVAFGNMSARLIVSYLNNGTLPESRYIKQTPAVCSIENLSDYYTAE